ncbi:hypothetical protein BDV06DRAFT_55778 [Aspergillus oleicola]
MAGSSASKNLIAVVIGAVILFGAISVFPIVIMRRHRRRAAERHANVLRHLQVNGSMRQATVGIWLDQQQTTTSDNLERYAGESCPICLTSLLAPSQPASALSHSLSGSTIHNIVPNQPTQPEAAHISPSHSHSSSHPSLRPDLDTCRSPILQTNNDDDRTRSPRSSLSLFMLSTSTSTNTLETRSNTRAPSSDPGSLIGVLILNRCNHAFHSACLASWFQYRQYRCPICADVLLAE